MSKWLILGVIFICALLQSTLLDFFRVFYVKPDLLLICAVMSGLLVKEYRWAIALSLFSGAIKDILCVNTLGINTLLFPLWTFLVIRLSRKVTLDNTPLRLLTIFLAALLNDISARLIFLFLGNPATTGGAFLRIVFFEPLYTSLAAFFILVKLIPRDIPS